MYKQSIRIDLSIHNRKIPKYDNEKQMEDGRKRTHNHYNIQYVDMSYCIQGEQRKLKITQEIITEIGGYERDRDRDRGRRGTDNIQKLKLKYL